MGQGMIFIPDQSIIRMGIRMLHRPHADVLVSDQGGNRCRIDRDADAVEAQFVGIHQADEIRDELLAKGIVLEDTREGVDKAPFL